MKAITELNSTVDALEKEIIDLLRSLVRIPSLTGEEKVIGDFVAEKCREIGLSVDIFEAAPMRPNVVAIWDTGIAGPTLLLNDHLDTFPPGEIEAWTHHPYAAVVADGYIHGRGTIDTKSGLTTLIMAVRALKKSGVKIRGKLKLVFSCDEETGGSKLGIRHLAKLGLLDADMALVAEPTTMGIEIATKSRLAVQITTHGKATHGARPWLGHNAILDMVMVVDELLKLNRQIEKRKHKLLGSSSLNIGVISGGTISNIVPDKCMLEIDRRLVPDEIEESVYGAISEIVERQNTQVPEFNGIVEKRQWWPGYIIQEDEPVIDAAKLAFRAAMNSEPIVAGKDASTDASWINILAGIPVIMFSPGEGSRAGNIDESVRIQDLVDGTRVVAQFVREVLGS